MSDADSEQKINQLSAKFDSLFLGFKAFLFLFLFFASVGNLVAELSIERYQQIFSDALPGKPLPSLTLLVLETKSLSMILVFVWPAIGLIALFIQRRITLALLLFCAALLCSLAQMTMVFLAMQMPLVTLICGMSDHP